MKSYWTLITVFWFLNSFIAIPMNTDSNNEASDDYLAELGHAEPMVALITKELMLSGHSDDNIQATTSTTRGEHFQKALQLFGRYYILLQLDAACYTDNNMVTTVTDYMKQQFFFKEINNAILKSDFKKILLEQLKWVKEKTKNHLLPSPTWITQSKIHTLCLFPQTTLIPESEWQKKRHNALKVIKKTLKEN